MGEWKLGGAELLGWGWPHSWCVCAHRRYAPYRDAAIAQHTYQVRTTGVRLGWPTSWLNLVRSGIKGSEGRKCIPALALAWPGAIAIATATACPLMLRHAARAAGRRRACGPLVAWRGKFTTAGFQSECLSFAPSISVLCCACVSKQSLANWYQTLPD